MIAFSAKDNPSLEALPTVSYIAFRVSNEAVHVLPSAYKGEKFGQGLYMCQFLAFVYFMRNVRPELPIHFDEMFSDKGLLNPDYQCFKEDAVKLRSFGLTQNCQAEEGCPLHPAFEPFRPCKVTDSFMELLWTEANCPLDSLFQRENFPNLLLDPELHTDLTKYIWDSLQNAFTEIAETIF